MNRRGATVRPVKGPAQSGIARLTKSMPCGAGSPLSGRKRPCRGPRGETDPRLFRAKCRGSVAGSECSMAGLASVLNEAIRTRWCTKVVCTTCGAGSYRYALAKARQGDPMGFTEALVSHPFESWLQFEDRRGAVFHALNALGGSHPVSPVLERWITRLDTPTWLLDAVLFDIVRTDRAESPIGRYGWTERCKRLR